MTERKRSWHLTQCPFKVLGMAGELAPPAVSLPGAVSPPTSAPGSPIVWLQAGMGGGCNKMYIFIF